MALATLEQPTRKVVDGPLSVLKLDLVPICRQCQGEVVFVEGKQRCGTCGMPTDSPTWARPQGIALIGNGMTEAELSAQLASVGLEKFNAEQRSAALQRENADLRRQLGNAPKAVQAAPTSAVSNPAPWTPNQVSVQLPQMEVATSNQEPPKKRR